MVKSEQETPITPKPPSQSLPAQSTPESTRDQDEPGISDHESDAVFVATAEPSSDESTGSIESTSEVDWSRVRTRAETVVSDGDEESDSGTYRSGEDNSYDMMTPSQSLELQSVPSRTTGTSDSVLSLEDAQSSIDPFFTDRVNYTSVQSNKLRFWQALCVEFGLVDSTSNPLPSFSDLGIISEDSETVSTTLSSSASVSTVSTSTATSSGPSASTRPRNNSLPPLPTSLRQAKLILENEAHVNLVDYVAARKTARSNATPARVDARGRPRNFAHLVHPSKRALIKYTRDNKKIYPRGDAKSEWLGPMLETLYGYHH